MAKYTKKEIFSYTISVIAFLFFLYFINSIPTSLIEKTALSLGWLGYLFLLLVIICSQVFAPISGTAFYLIGIKLYGFGTLMIIFYFSSVMSAAISFYIARRWGRRIVVKLVGTKSMDHIDSIAETHDTYLLVIGRTLGFFFFDFISYALGFTTISFKKYIGYTAALTVIPLTIQYFVFRNTNFDSFGGSAIWYVSTLITGLIFAFLFARIIQNKKRG
jgi:uncharacterized membrane protein YdjX (TVP38/TMEM64 family)